MREIHCHTCGGFIGGDPREISYRRAPATVLMAAPHSSLCACDPPVLYEAPPGYLSSPGMPSAGGNGA